MPKHDDDILGQEIGKAGALGGRLGGGIAGAGGGRLGGIVAAKLLPTQEFELTMMLQASNSAVANALTGILATEGTILNSEASPGAITIRGLVHVGFLNMNPAILIAYIEKTGPDATSVRIIGKAKEGLIKQHTAEKAVRRFSEALLSQEG